MKKYKDHTLQEYLDALSQKTPVPGGGSAAALVAATGVALILMVAQYSKGKALSKSVESRIRRIISSGTALRRRLVALIDLDAQAYFNVVKSRTAGKKTRTSALRTAAGVPREVCRLCYQGMDLLPFLVAKGNKHLMSDVEVAAEMLLAAFNAAMINVKVNS